MNLKSSPCDYSLIIDEALKCGAEAAGFADLQPDPEDKNLYEQWIKRGHNAQMQYMVTGLEPRFNPDLVLHGAQSALCTAFSYAPASPDDSHPLFSDYARGKDYHMVLRSRLEPVAALMEMLVPGSHTRICVDSAPVRERFLAVRSGIGLRTRSGLIYVPGAGCQVFIAEILWTHRVPAAPVHPAENPCSGCEICVKSCPGRAILGDGTVDARKCLAYLTIEHKDELPEDLRLPGRIYGCDVCARVCPLNRHHSPALPEFRLDSPLYDIDAEALENMGSSAYRRLSRGRAFSRIPLTRMLRNLRRH